MDTEPAIRNAGASDLGSISALATQWEDEDSAYGQGAADPAPYLENGYLLVADAGGTLIGFLAARVGDRELAVFEGKEPYIELEELYITPDRRSSGVGSALVERLKELARRDGIKRFHVFSASRNLDDVIAFYGKHGFQMWGMQAYATDNET